MSAKKIPNLLIFPQEEESQFTASLFGLEDNKTLHVEFRNKLRNAHCCGLSNGWLMMVNEKGNNLYILNPFLGFQIQLPILHYQSDFLLQSYDFVAKSLLTSDPKNSDCKAVVIYGRNSRIGYCKLGQDESWVDLDCKHNSYCDIIYHNQLLFALSGKGYVEVWDFQRTLPKQLMNIQLPFPTKSQELRHSMRDLCATTCYLVESDFNILLVVRFVGELVDENGKPVYESDLMTDEDTHPKVCPYRTLFFHVYRLDFNNEKWIEIDSLGDQALFLGGSESISVSVSVRDSTSTNCKANSIYFTDDYWDRMDEDYLYGGHDIGVFSMRDQRVAPFYFDTQKMLPPPIWIVS